MKLLVQGDDFGFTKAVTLGIVEAIDHGILRNTGLFANMPAAKLAASFMKDRPQACFGIDFNLVAGKPVSDPKEVPHLVDENGDFIKSGVRIKDQRWQSEQGRREMFPYDEVRKEIRAQYNKFIELTGTKPGYLHAHSISSETYNEAIIELSKETGIPYSMQFLKEKGVVMAGMHRSSATSNKTFDPNEQLNKNTTADVLRDKDLILSSDLAMVIGHPGYLDAELLKMTSLSIERVKDLAMMVDPEIKKMVEENNIELITYRDLLK